MLYLRVVFRDQSFIYIKCLFATYQRYFHTGTGDLSVTCMCPIESGLSEIDNSTLYPNIFYSLTSIFRHISKCCVGDAAARAASATHRFPENISQIISCHLIFTLDKNELRKLFPRTLLEYTLIFRFINHLITQHKIKIVSIFAHINKQNGAKIPVMSSGVPHFCHFFQRWFCSCKVSSIYVHSMGLDSLWRE